MLFAEISKGPFNSPRPITIIKGNAVIKNEDIQHQIEIKFLADPHFEMGYNQYHYLVIMDNNLNVLRMISISIKHPIYILHFIGPFYVK